MDQTADITAPLLDEAEFEDNINFRILRLASKMSVIFQRSTLRPNGLTVQEWRILISLARHGSGHLRELARRANLDASHVSRAVRKLEKRSLLARNADSVDQRLVMFHLTPPGRDLVLRLWPEARALYNDFNRLHSPRDFAVYKAAIDRAMAHADTLLDAAADPD